MMKTAVLKTLAFERPVDLKSAIVAQGVASAHSQKADAFLSERILFSKKQSGLTK
jgi:hypothetical protein